MRPSATLIAAATAAARVAPVLDRQIRQPSTADMAQVVTALGRMPDPESLLRAVSQTLPRDVSASAIRGTMASLNRVIATRTESSNMGSAAAGSGLSSGEAGGDRQVWIMPFESRTNQGDRGGESGFSASTSGLAAGAEMEFDSARAGLSYAYASTSASGNTAITGTGSRSRIESNMVALYGSLPLGEISLGWQADLGRNGNRLDRQMQFGGLNRIASSRFQSWHAHLGTNVSFTLPLSEAMSLVPALQLDYLHRSGRAQGQLHQGAGTHFQAGLRGTDVLLFDLLCLQCAAEVPGVSGRIAALLRSLLEINPVAHALRAPLLTSSAQLLQGRIAMLIYLLRRLAIALCVALTVSVVSFTLLHLSGDLAVSIAGPEATAAQVESVRTQFGLDRPLTTQYVDWLGRAVQLDFGKSFYFQGPVMEMISERLPITIKLGGSALLLAILTAIPLGVLAALYRDTWLDRTALLIAVVGQAMPSFWFGLTLILLFAVTLHWLPVAGNESWQHFILPAVALGYYAMPAMMRLTRSGMLEVLGSDYIRTARAKGLSKSRVVFKHALRNAVIPVVALAAVELGFMLGGSVVIESVYSMQGLGQLAWDAISRNDYPVVQAVVLIIAMFYIGLTFLADVINALLDPRIRTR